MAEAPSASSEPAGPPSRGASPASRLGPPATAGVCLCRVDGRLFAIDTSLVAEVTTLERLLPVPGCPPAVLGLFSLRGTPVAVVDLLVALGQPAAAPPSGEVTVLVLRPGAAPLAALRIDRMDAVVPSGQGTPQPVEPGTEHPAVAGIFEPGGGRPPATLLDPRHLLAAVRQLSFSRPDRREST